MILYFPNLQKVDVHIKDRIFKFITIIILYILYVLITKEISIKPDITSLINFFNGTFIGLLIIITHTIVSLLTGSIKINTMRADNGAYADFTVVTMQIVGDLA